MKLSELKRDVSAIEQGAWIGKKYGTPVPNMGDLCIKTRGQNNADWRALESKLIAAIPMQRKLQGLSPDDRDKVTAECLLNAGLQDWDGIEDDNGVSVPYSKDQATLFLTDDAYRDVRDAVLFASSLVGTATAKAMETDAKNS